MKFNKLVSAVGFAAAMLSANSWAAVDAKIPEYQKVTGISGNLSSVGSDTLANMMTLWAEEFKRVYPNVNIQIQAAGSSTAPPALTEGTSQLGPMSRKMKEGEIEAFEKRYGYKPTAIPVAIDALAVFVHKDNPIKGMTMLQLVKQILRGLNGQPLEPMPLEAPSMIGSIAPERCWQWPRQVLLSRRHKVEEAARLSKLHIQRTSFLAASQS